MAQLGGRGEEDCVETQSLGRGLRFQVGMV